jgi:DNA-binding transcriptional regulator YhcF (GntR family)
MIPHIVDDMELSAIAYRVLGHLIRRAGENGEAFEGVRGMAKACKLANGSITKAKRELEERGLITIKKGTKKGVNGDPDRERICDIWKRNSAYFEAKAKEKQGLSVYPPSTYYLGKQPVYPFPRCSPGDTKGEPIKELKKPSVWTVRESTFPSSNHPALIVFEDRTGQGVFMSHRQKVIDAVGENPDDVLAWGKFVSLNVIHGGNPDNPESFVDAWVRRQPDSGESEEAMAGRYLAERRK